MGNINIFQRLNSKSVYSNIYSVDIIPGGKDEKILYFVFLLYNFIF